MNKSNNTHPKLLILAAATILFFGSTASMAETKKEPTKQEMVRHMGHDIMPFDLAKTTHVFQMTETGGIEWVVVKDMKDKDQVMLIQQHMQHEAEAFQRGDYSDPAWLHGNEMPGLLELHKGAAQIKVTYSAQPTGASITFETKDLHLLTAIHRWFGAQLSEHGADAMTQ